MKTLALKLMPLMILFSVSAQAGTVFKGNAKATKHNDGLQYAPATFSTLEQLGVERAAEKNALQLCADAGATDCVLTSASTTACNVRASGDNGLEYAYSECGAVATARGN